MPGSEKKMKMSGTMACMTGAFGLVREPSGARSMEPSGQQSTKSRTARPRKTVQAFR